MNLLSKHKNLYQFISVNEPGIHYKLNDKTNFIPANKIYKISFCSDKKLLSEKATFESRVVKLKKSKAGYEAYLLPHSLVPLRNRHHPLHPLEKQ